MRPVPPALAVLAVLASLGFAAPRAIAQASPTGNMHSPQMQPQASEETPLPDAIPGAGGQRLRTSQDLSKPQSGDPTAQLFDAVNRNDYNAAQDAISRGADLNAQNALGETPIALSVALNHNSITFLLLASRNDAGSGVPDQLATPIPVAAPAALPHGPARRHTAPAAAMPARFMEKPAVIPAAPRRAAVPAAPGTPNPSAGFLGFNP